MSDPFASGPIALTLAWLATGGVFIYAALGLLKFLLDKADAARPFKVWLVLCLAALAPARYIFFQAIAGLTFPFQSFSGFLLSFILVLYVPLVFGVLYLVGIGIPVGVTILVLGDEENRDAGRYIGASVVLPIVCLLGSWLFYLTLPLAASTVRWLPAEPVIKATNGPAAFAFDHVASQFTPMAVPKYFELTPQDAKALRRCHIAAVYLGAEEELKFLRKAYPDVYEAVTE